MRGVTDPFYVGLCVSYVEMLLRHDEVERALWVLENTPAYHRDNPPQELVTLREEILAHMYTPGAYQSSTADSVVDPDTALTTLMNLLRGKLIEKEVRHYNQQGDIPHLVDLGPGNYFVPLGLYRAGHRFTYKDVALNAIAKEATRHLSRSEKAEFKQPVIFLALEVIEHLPSPRDLAIDCLRICGKAPERIHLSTPLYTFDTNHTDWRVKGGLPHLRAYTPKEFIREAGTLFPGYDWLFCHDAIMSLRGSRRDAKDRAPFVMEAPAA